MVMGIDISDATIDAMIDYASDVALGLVVHAVAGTQLMATGHHMADNLLAVKQFSGCAASALPGEEALPNEGAESACIATYYCCSLRAGGP